MAGPGFSGKNSLSFVNRHLDDLLADSRRSLDSLGSLDISAWGLASKNGRGPCFGPNAT